MDVKWVAMENATGSTLTSVAGEAAHTLNVTGAQFVTHPSFMTASGIPIAAMLGFVPGIIVGFKKG